MESNLKEYVLNCSNAQITATRQNLMKQINGDLFYPMSLWPTRMRQSFWAKPIGDEDTSKLSLFLVENGCPPWLAKDWILTSTFWDKTKTIKRLYQTEWILTNRENHRNDKTWFYFEIHLNKYVYLDGSDRYYSK